MACSAAMTLSSCPSCGSDALVPTVNRLDCRGCRGCFVETSRLEAMLAEMTRAPFRLDDAMNQPGTLTCPHCASVMVDLELFDVTAARCRQHGVWFAAGGFTRVLQHAGGAKPTPPRRWYDDLSDDPHPSWAPRDLETIERDQQHKPLRRPAKASPVASQSPYRDSQLACPACAQGLRRFRDRLCCDGCNGIMLGIADLEEAIQELISTVVELGFTNDLPGARSCPCCQSAMVRCRLDVWLMDERPELQPELDRCDGHGVWFDALELAKIFEVLRRVATTSSGSSRPRNPATLP